MTNHLTFGAPVWQDEESHKRYLAVRMLRASVQSSLPAWLLDVGARRFSTQGISGPNQDLRQPEGRENATTPPCAFVRCASEPANPQAHFGDRIASSSADLDASLERAMRSIFLSSMRQVSNHQRLSVTFIRVSDLSVLCPMSYIILRCEMVRELLALSPGWREAEPLVCGRASSLGRIKRRQRSCRQALCAIQRFLTSFLTLICAGPARSSYLQLVRGYELKVLNNARFCSDLKESHKFFNSKEI